MTGKFARQSPADRPVEGRSAGGKSGLRRAGCWITSSQRELKDSATETDRRWRRGLRPFRRTGKGGTVV